MYFFLLNLKLYLFSCIKILILLKSYIKGVTSKDMLRKKTLKELIKPFEERKTQLVDFIENVSQFTSKSHQK